MSSLPHADGVAWLAGIWAILVGAAALSIVTAILLWRLIPIVVKIPSVAQLRAVIESFEAEVQMRRAAEDRLRDSELRLALTFHSIAAESAHDIGMGSDDNGRNSQQRRAESALKSSESRLRFTMEAARVGEWEIDLQTGSGRHSLLAARCFGQDEIIPGWNVDRFLALVHSDDRAAVARSFTIACGSVDDSSLQCRVVWPDGSIHWISIHRSLLRDNGVPVRMLCIIMDVTEQQLAEDPWHKALRLAGENQQIQESSRLKTLFLANISHELRTPLNAVIGFADLLHSGAVPLDSPKYQEFLGYIGTSGRHLLLLINDVLDLSKVEAGKLQFHAERIVLASLVDEVRAVLHSAIQQKHVSIAVDLDPAVTDIVLDQHRLKQILYNYLSNAIKFTRDRGHVVVRVRAEGLAHLRIEVQDDGIGIAAADVPKLFSEFRQLDPGFSRQHPGTGLGLALTRRLVEAQGGTVGVRSTLGRGSLFFLTLNRIHGTDAPRGEASGPKRQL